MVIHSIIDPLEIMERKRDPSGLIQGIAGENGLTVTRLVSTDPAMYLDPRYQPGAAYPSEQAREGH